MPQATSLVKKLKFSIKTTKRTRKKRKKSWKNQQKKQKIAFRQLKALLEILLARNVKTLRILSITTVIKKTITLINIPSLRSQKTSISLGTFHADNY